VSADVPSKKVSSRDFYREMRNALSAQMKAAGYAPLKGSSATWQRSAPGALQGSAEGLFSCSFQVDKWGWDPLWGARFNLEFILGEVAGARSVGGGRAQRFGMLLEGFDDLEEARVFNNAIIARLPGTREGRLVTQRLKDGRDIVVQGVRADHAPFEAGFDYWLSYHSLEDVRQWAAWFAPRMARYLALFEGDRRSPFGEGRRRFDEVLGRVQALPAAEGEAKAALLQAYRREEPVPYWQSAAAFWIDEIRERGGKGATL
jgi:hypothetical protein